MSVERILRFVRHESPLSFTLCFYLSRRCGPCKFIAPIFEKMAEANPDVEFVKVDVDDAEDVAAECGIQAMPTFQCFKGGEKVDEMRGADQGGLEAMVAKNK